ncbi:MAG: NUDIX domain-containing protein, partial [Rhodospirillales bacterium]
MHDDPHCLKRYRELAKSDPRLFHNPPGCPTRILLDDGEIAAAQAEVRWERESAGHSTEDLRVGVLAEDHYIGFVLRDAVRFADGKAGLYNRVAATGGIAVLPILDNRIALIRIFRHALRAWSLEAPQGLMPPGADPAAEVRRELMEEMGATANE